MRDQESILRCMVANAIHPDLLITVTAAVESGCLFDPMQDVERLYRGRRFRLCGMERHRFGLPEASGERAILKSCMERPGFSAELSGLRQASCGIG